MAYYVASCIFQTQHGETLTGQPIQIYDI